MNSRDQKDAKNECTTSSNCNKMSEWLPHCAPFERPQFRIIVILSRGLFPKSKKGKEKRRYSLLVFWMESFRSTNRLSYWDNGSCPPCCALPAPLPPHPPSLYLPLSRNTRHILLNTTHQPKVHFLLLGSSPSHQTLFPGHALTAPHMLK